MKHFYLKLTAFALLCAFGITGSAQIVVPTVTTDSVGTVISQATNVTPTTAYVYGNIISYGGDSYTNGGIALGTSPKPNANDNIGSTSGGYSTGSFYTYFSGLTPNTVYYARAYATNSTGTSYGAQLTFTTTVATLATVTTDSVSLNGLTATTVQNVYGTLKTNGGDPNATGGFCYGTSPNPTTAVDSLSAAYSMGSFSDNLSGLKPNTKYYIRAFAANIAGVSYGAQITFTTTVASAPTETTDSITIITATTASGAGTVLTNGGDPNLTAGICYGISPNPTIADSFANTYYYAGQNGVFAFVNVPLTHLIPSTTYYARAYAINGNGIPTYGNQLTFSTFTDSLPNITTDSLGTYSYDTITATTATVYGNLISQGGDPATKTGICYSTTSPNPTIANSVAKNTNSGRGSFSVSLSGLTPNTTYYASAYAVNAAGTIYGKPLTFTTLPAVKPTVTTDTITTITDSTANGYLTIDNNGGDPNLSSGICFGTSLNPTTANSIGLYQTPVSQGNALVAQQQVAQLGGTYYHLSGLTSNTTYYVRAYAINPAGISYGNQLQFTTNFGVSILTQNESSLTGCNGYLQAVANGVPPFTYVWNDSTSVNSPYRFNVCGGKYYVTVTDSTGRSSSAYATLGSNPPASTVPAGSTPLDLIVHSQDASNVNLCNGAVNIRISGGTPPYSISFGGASITGSNYTINNLCSGFYTINVKDAKSQASSWTFVVGSPATTYNSIPPSFVADSVFKDTLVAPALNNCTIFNGTVDSLAIQSYSLFGTDSINVVWGVYQKGNATIIPINQAYKYNSFGLCRVVIGIYCTSRSSSSIRGVADVEINPRGDGIETLSLSTISVYPNPFSSTFTVSGINGNADVKVFNSLGLTVYSEKGVSGNTQINLQGYSSGVYIIQVISADGVVSRNVIKE